MFIGSIRANTSYSFDGRVKMGFFEKSPIGVL